MAQIAGGSRTAAARKSRQSSQSNMPTAPVRKATLPSQESAASESTRWISLTSLVIREIISPSGVLAKNLGERAVQVPVDGHAHVEEDLGRDLRVAHPAEEVQDEAGRGDQGEEDDDPHQGVRVLAQQGVVDEGAGEEGDVEGERSARQVESQDDREAALVGKDVGEAAADFLVENGHSVTLGAERCLRQIPRRISAPPE